MVCINPDGKRRYNGFFGTTDDATIMNLNLEDCYLASNDVKGIMQNYGTLIGVTRNTTLKNCHVSKSVVKVNYNYDGYTDDIFCCVGGMIGQLDNPGNNNFSSFKTNMTNCSFKGNIYVNVPQTGHALSTRVGGLFAHQYKDPAFFAYQYIYPSIPQPPSKNDIELKEKEATQKKRLKEVKIATRRHKIPLPHNAT